MYKSSPLARLIWGQRSSGAVPFTTMFAMLLGLTYVWPLCWQAAICVSHFVGKHFSKKLFMKDSKTRFFHHTESATNIHSRELTWTLKMMVWSRNFLSTIGICGVLVFGIQVSEEEG